MSCGRSPVQATMTRPRMLRCRIVARRRRMSCSLQADAIILQSARWDSFALRATPSPGTPPQLTEESMAPEEGPVPCELAPAGDASYGNRKGEPADESTERLV